MKPNQFNVWILILNENILSEYLGLWNLSLGATSLRWRDLLPRLAAAHRPDEPTLQRQQDLRRQADQETEGWSHSEFLEIYGSKITYICFKFNHKTNRRIKWKM